MVDEPKYSVDPSIVPTKELLKSLRKKDYERSKKLRRMKREEELEALEEQKNAERKLRDEQLWASLRKAKDIDKK